MKIKGKVTVTPEEQELALSLMEEIAYDNGFFNRWNPEKYDAKWVNKIGPIAKNFFDKNPGILNNCNIEEICCSEHSEIQNQYGHLEGFKQLHEALNDYFDNH